LAETGLRGFARDRSRRDGDWSRKKWRVLGSRRVSALLSGLFRPPNLHCNREFSIYRFSLYHTLQCRNLAARLGPSISLEASRFTDPAVIAPIQGTGFWQQERSIGFSSRNSRPLQERVRISRTLAQSDSGRVCGREGQGDGKLWPTNSRLEESIRPES
jgi:hypothetical protein